MSGRAAFAGDYALTPEALARFDRYADALALAQTRANLVGPTTLAEVWTRHFADSAQLMPLGVAGGRWLDLGAGAGFPGLVLALLGADVDLVEATGKKVAFLQEMIALLDLGASTRVHHARIESLAPFEVATITARALAPLPKLFDYGLRFAAQHTRWVLPKGARIADELAEAQLDFVFEARLHPSRTSPEGRIVIADGVGRKERDAARHR